MVDHIYVFGHGYYLVRRAKGYASHIVPKYGDVAFNLIAKLRP